MIYRATQILKQGRQPNREKDGISLNQIQGIIGWVKRACNYQLPSRLLKTIHVFETELQFYKQQKTSQAAH